MFTRDVKVRKIGIEEDGTIIYKDATDCFYHLHPDGSITDHEGVGENVTLIVVEDFSSDATIASIL